MNGSFHIQLFPPNDVWPVGGWSIYRINGDEIAQRIKFDKAGRVIERHSWCGYIGIVATLAEIPAAIDASLTAI